VCVKYFFLEIGFSASAFLYLEMDTEKVALGLLGAFLVGREFRLKLRVNVISVVDDTGSNTVNVTYILPSMKYICDYFYFQGR